MNGTIFWIWIAILLAMIVSRFFVKGKLERSFAAHYKDWAHLLWGGGFVYACFRTSEIESADLAEMAIGIWVAGSLWFLLALALVVEVVMAIVNNYPKRTGSFNHFPQA